MTEQKEQPLVSMADLLIFTGISFMMIGLIIIWNYYVK
jgi:hypothetical protein